MKIYVFLILFAASCAPLDGLENHIRLTEGATRAGTALRLPDGRLIAVRVVSLSSGPLGMPCGEWHPPDTIILVNDSRYCPRLEIVLAHEVGHSVGKEHALTGIMAPFPYENNLW
jgi:hypothetical protein